MIQGDLDIGDLLMHHTADAYSIEGPFFHLSWEHLRLPDIHLGAFTFNITPTKHVLFMVLAALLVFLTMWLTGRKLEKQRADKNAPKGFANAVEAFVLWIRSDLALANLGHEGARYAPFVMTLFFFILFCNLLGLLPWGAAATGNYAVTGGLALLAFLTIEIGGMAKLGFGGYMRTIFPVIPGMTGVMGVAVSIFMAPIEILGKLIKPFALCVRLFGNMTAGHFVILSLFGLIFLFGHLPWIGRLAIAGATVTLVTGIMLLELIVAFVQAYVFAIITAVLIGLMQHEH